MKPKDEKRMTIIKKTTKDVIKKTKTNKNRSAYSQILPSEGIFFLFFQRGH